MTTITKFQPTHSIRTLNAKQSSKPGRVTDRAKFFEFIDFRYSIKSALALPELVEEYLQKWDPMTKPKLFKSVDNSLAGSLCPANSYMKQPFLPETLKELRNYYLYIDLIQEYLKFHKLDYKQSGILVSRQKQLLTHVKVVNSNILATYN